MIYDKETLMIIQNAILVMKHYDNGEDVALTTSRNRLLDLEQKLLQHGGCYVAGARSNDPINGFVQYARKLRGENELLKEDLSGLREFKERMKKIVNEQAEDGGLWGFSETATEAYLQQALRRMHSEIETT